MKQKRLSKKLTLNKKTIAGLDHLQLNAVYGGIDTAISHCYCCDTGNPNSCTFPETQDPTATVTPRMCACCH
jgi:hypothetical protein